MLRKSRIIPEENFWSESYFYRATMRTQINVISLLHASGIGM